MRSFFQEIMHQDTETRSSEPRRDFTEKNSGETSAVGDTPWKLMGGVELCISEDGTLKGARQDRLRSLKGLERHRVFRWLNCNILPLDKVPEATNYLRSPDDFYNRVLRAVFLFTLSVGVIKISYEYWVTCTRPSIWNTFPVFAAAIIAAAVVAAAIVQKKRKNKDFTPPRTEEVKTVCGLIQQV